MPTTFKDRKWELNPHPLLTYHPDFRWPLRPQQVSLTGLSKHHGASLPRNLVPPGDIQELYKHTIKDLDYYNRSTAKVGLWFRQRDGSIRDATQTLLGS